MSRTNDRTYQRNRARLKRSGDACWRRHLPIDTDLVWPHPMSWTADHIKPIKDGGHNLGPILPAHCQCNVARNRKRHQSPVRHGRTW